MSNAEPSLQEFYILAQIRDALGVGYGPMLTELPYIVDNLRRERNTLRKRLDRNLTRGTIQAEHEMALAKLRAAGLFDEFEADAAKPGPSRLVWSIAKALVAAREDKARLMAIEHAATVLILRDEEGLGCTLEAWADLRRALGMEG